MNSEQTSEKKFAISVVLKAIPLCKQIQTDMETVGALERKAAVEQGYALTKADGSLVTGADFSVQALICQAIAEPFPGDPIVAEEDSQELQKNPQLLKHVTEYVNRFTEGSLSTRKVCDLIDRGGGEAGKRFWTLDPIDGTKEFLGRGSSGAYSIALALIVNGEVKLGVLGCPNLRQKWDASQSPLGCLFVAERGKGAWMHSLAGEFSERIHVSQTTRRLVDTVESSHSDTEAHEQIAQQMGLIEKPIKIIGQAKHGVLSRGEASIYMNLLKPGKEDYRETIWDYAAAVIVMEEAGGVVTDADGHPLDFSQGKELPPGCGILATNGVLHPQLLECVREWTEERMELT